MTNRVSAIVSDEQLNRIIQIESAGKPAAKAPTSSAFGLGQFIDPTWDAVLKQHRPDLYKLHEQHGVIRRDPSLQIEMLARFTEDNAKALGPDWTDGDLYLAHFLGVGTAKKFLRAPDNAPAEPIAGPQAVHANLTILSHKTAKQVRDWAQTSMITRWNNAGRPDWVGKYYNGAASPQAAAPVQQPVPPKPEPAPVPTRPTPEPQALKQPDQPEETVTMDLNKLRGWAHTNFSHLAPIVAEAAQNTNFQAAGRSIFQGVLGEVSKAINSGDVNKALAIAKEAHDGADKLLGAIAVNTNASAHIETPNLPPTG